MTKKVILSGALLLLVSFAGYAQCAMCKAAAEESVKHDPNSVAKGLNTGIIFLMTIPYVVVGIIFRKELIQVVRNLRNREKTPFNKRAMGNMTFALTFITCAVILFVFFISFYQPA